MYCYCLDLSWKPADTTGNTQWKYPMGRPITGRTMVKLFNLTKPCSQKTMNSRSGRDHVSGKLGYLES